MGHCLQSLAIDLQPIMNQPKSVEINSRMGIFGIERQHTLYTFSGYEPLVPICSAFGQILEKCVYFGGHKFRDCDQLWNRCIESSYSKLRVFLEDVLVDDSLNLILSAVDFILAIVVFIVGDRMSQKCQMNPDLVHSSSHRFAEDNAFVRFR